MPPKPSQFMQVPAPAGDGFILDLSSGGSATWRGHALSNVRVNGVLGSQHGLHPEFGEHKLMKQRANLNAYPCGVAKSSTKKAEM